MFDECSADMTSSTEQSSSTESSMATSESGEEEEENDHVPPKQQKSPRPRKPGMKKLKQKPVPKVNCVRLLAL